MAKKNKKEKDYHCELLPYERYECLSIQDAKQKSGWGITAFDLPKTWNVTQGEGVVIAVLDTGCDLNHPDLKENLVEGANFINRRKSPEDGNGHGCVSPECLIQTSYSGIDTIENFYNEIDTEESKVKHPEGIYFVKNVSQMNIKTYSFDSETQKTTLGKINSVQKLPINNEIINIKLDGNISYSLTPWHPVYLLRNKHHNIYEVIRKRADEVTINDRFIFPKGGMAGRLGEDDIKFILPKKFVCNNCNHIPKYWKEQEPTKCKKCNRLEWKTTFEEVVINEDLAWLAGIVLTDGHISKDRFEVTSETKEILTKTKTICDKLNWTNVIEKKRILVYGHSGVSYLKAMGLLAKNKSTHQTLPEWTGKCKFNVLSAFIAGIIDGDGCISKTNTKNRITTASKELAYQLSALLNSTGVSSSVSSPEYDSRKDRKIRSDKPCYKVTHAALGPEVIKHLIHPKKLERSKIIPRHNRKARRVKSISRSKYQGYFYDFTVEEHHNYIANGHYVSNTHVTGILVAANNDIGMVGVCPKAKAMPIKVLDDKGNGNLLSVAEGVRHAADNGADIITMSLGAPIKVQQVRKAIQYAASKGIPTFVAAGNAGNTKEVFYPANYPETIAVGAIDSSFNRASFSNTGENLDFMAPGVDIFSTVPDDWYATLSGTSMACPFAVGVAALVLSYAKKGKAKFKLETVDDYRNIFRKHTIPVNGNGKKFYQGFGIIDPRKWSAELM